MSDNQGPKPDLEALAAIPDAITRLQRSSRGTTPIALIGLALTLGAAGISTYYAFSYSQKLRAAEARLNDTTRQLAETRVSLSMANEALAKVKTSSTAAEVRQNVSVAEAYVNRGEQRLAQASTALVDAAVTLPNIDTSQTGWFTVVGSYPISAAGMELASGQAAALAGRGACAEIWQTQFSKNYAVVLGGMTDAKAASATAKAARRRGLAPDAFPQRDAGWMRVAGSADCSRRDAQQGPPVQRGPPATY